MIKILATIDIQPLVDYYESMADKVYWLDSNKCKQTSLQYKTGEDPKHSGLGRGNGTDNQYVNLNTFYSNSICEELINKFSLCRTRLMLLEPWSCYSMHRDSSPRIHIPIITNPECYFVFKEDGLVQHISIGNVYWVDTTKFHTFVNCSPHRRIHLMGSVEK